MCFDHSLNPYNDSVVLHLEAYHVSQHSDHHKDTSILILSKLVYKIEILGKKEYILTKPLVIGKHKMNTRFDNKNISSLLSVFRCRLCWTITGAVFASILAIEGIILIPSYQAFQQEQFARIEASGLMVVQTMFALTSQNASPDPETLLRYGKTLVQSTVLLGATIYAKDGALFGMFGERRPKQRLPSTDVSVTTDGAPNEQSMAIDCTDTDHCFDIKWSPTQVGAPFRVEARLDSRSLEGAGFAYIQRILGLILIIAAFVTITTMIVLNRLVLSPILLLRRHMVSAGEDLDTPLRHRLPNKHSDHAHHDELGVVFAAFNDMLMRLSDGIQALHTANDKLEQRVEERTADLHAANRILETEMMERTRAEEESRNLARFPGENTSPVLRVGRDGVILYANAASTPLLNLWQTEKGRALPSEWIQLIQDVLQTSSDKHVELPVGDRIFSVRLAPVPDAGYANLYGTDVTERREYEDQLRHLANYDTLTGLPNRSLFQDRWQQAITHARLNDGMCAVSLIGLDGFKEIDQAAGKEAGHVLRKMIAQRLPACVPETATVARLGGDVFAIVHAHVEKVSDPADTAQRVFTVLSKPFQLGHDRVEIHASVGMTLFPSDGTDPERLLHLADLAMSRAKADPRRNSYRFYEAGMNEAVQERRDLLRDLREAVARGHLEIHYQPQVSLADNRLIGMEALLRWRHPEKGLISPGHFIPLAEESRLIVPIGLWVLQTACKQNKQWQDAGLERLKVAVNLSSVQFGEAKLVESVASAIQESGLDPQFLELEITESVAMEGAEKTIATLEALHELGLSLSIDDFGTGYSSLSYLKKFPVKKVKIDRSFVCDLEQDSESAALCHAIVQLGHSLNLQVIAEGVETIEQLRLIRDMGCDQVQGYYYSRPLDVTAFARFVKEWHPE